ncbi:Ger(x)C family spore germination protein [Bacillus sp. TH22]|uniref:Ger(x)C family spore germination protein n=1 Tax=unclassified Bacillus (in: firmicutes) TaxID=185979 RepID=UPI001912E5E7|nr:MULTISPECIES: Ger(x)C family spore germination protein [unclassified Bacillus (in: firmicutes)]MBK5360242.1 Ger(x)C family spore germination protein [Bacillus sp. TH44]MBK5350669.1 Ger(x)C family spore germination protein [Bacillus sp. TH45]MBK5367110.1 Ger(x)C family spore germination protein [Bacillus sp. TH50]MBK5447803.1 Ger(x)C family spore germination protein [Bacillus sp. TH22]MBK5453354.1 Ger(x)C family spore germination protein [Bacillus sp. TH23]
MNQNVKGRKIIIRITSIVFLLLLTGCWSSHEIEELGFAVGIAIDKEKETKIEKEIEEKGGGYKKKNLITTTYQFVKAQSSSDGGKGGVSQQKAYMNVAETGDSLHQSIREVALRRQRPIIFHHTKVIVVSESIARTYKLTQLLDIYVRDNEMRPSCFIMVSKGLASDVLKSKELGEIPAFRLIDIEDNQYRSSRILPPMPLAKLPGKVKSGASFLLPNVISINGEVKYVGAAVMKGSTKKLRGFLNENELEGLMWITAKGKSGLVKSYDKKTKKLVMYEVKSMESKITPHVKGDKISFDVNVQSVGRLSENWSESEEAFKNTFLKRTEQSAEQEVKRLVKHTLQKIQKEYKTDVAGFNTSLKIEYPKVWKKVEKDWDKVFSKAPIKYNVKLTIEDYGTEGA